MSFLYYVIVMWYHSQTHCWARWRGLRWLISAKLVCFAFSKVYLAILQLTKCTANLSCKIATWKVHGNIYLAKLQDTNHTKKLSCKIARYKSHENIILQFCNLRYMWWYVFCKFASYETWWILSCKWGLMRFEIKSITSLLSEGLRFLNKFWLLSILCSCLRDILSSSWW